MRQADFVARHEAEWRSFEHWLSTQANLRQARRRVDIGGSDDLVFAARFRRLCQQLAIAEQRGYGPAVRDRLEVLVQGGHHLLYLPPPPRWKLALDFLYGGFPALVRRHHRFVLVSAALLFVPMLAMAWLLQWRPELVYSVFSGAHVAELERMYDPSDPSRALGRASGTDLAMFGFYIFNNISIAFRTFAGGLFAGLGTVAVLVANGVMIGSSMGHLARIGSGGAFWPFVAGHSAPELSGIVLAGAAGLRVGWAMLAPGLLPRRRALVEAAQDAAQLVIGVFGLLLLAAFIEAYWSSIGWLPHALKYGVGLALWLVLWTWLLRGGRHAA
jgi:uncharacterized membrane protein SpoIIM required for sporulation